MDFNGINLPDLTPRIDTSFIDEMIGEIRK